ncbi:TolC family protein [candidate division KSB1 bacterium]|nr:TolC family protein [candidate division KSB1 bacterium]
MKVHILLLPLSFYLLCAFHQVHAGSKWLDEYIQEALDSNREILSARLATSAAQQENQLYSTLPDPTFMIEGRAIPLDLHVRDTRELMFMFEQMIPAPGVLKRMQKSGEFAADIQAEMGRAVENDIMSRVKSLYSHLYYVDQALASNKKHLQLLDEIEEIAESSYIVNASGQQALYQIRIEKARLQADSLSLQQQRRSKQAEMNRLLKLPLDGHVPTDSALVMPNFPFKINVDSLLELSNPFLRAAKIGTAASENAVMLARARGLPALQLMGGYMLMNDMDDAVMGRISVTLPFMPWANADSRAASARSQILARQSALDYEILLDKLRVKFITAQNELAALLSQIDLYRNVILPASARTVRLSVAAYQSNSLDFISLVQYARQDLQNQLAQIELSSQYLRTWAELENIIGQSIRGDLE